MIINSISMNVKKDGGNVHSANVTTEYDEVMDIMIHTNSDNPTQSAIANACMFEINSVYAQRHAVAKAKHEEKQKVAREKAFDEQDAKDDPGPAEAEAALNVDSASSVAQSDLDKALEDLEEEVPSESTEDKVTMKQAEQQMSGKTRDVEKPSMKNTHDEMDAFITEHGVQGVNPGDTKGDKLQKISLHFGGVV